VFCSIRPDSFGADAYRLRADARPDSRGSRTNSRTSSASQHHIGVNQYYKKFRSETRRSRRPKRARGEDYHNGIDYCKKEAITPVGIDSVPARYACMRDFTGHANFGIMFSN
jgi:hypothetical protein